MFGMKDYKNMSGQVTCVCINDEEMHYGYSHKQFEQHGLITSTSLKQQHSGWS